MVPELEKLEREILIHRYLYYIEACPIISDFEYDSLEKEARSVLPETSPVQGIGSSLPSSYTKEIIEEALRRIL